MFHTFNVFNTLYINTLTTYEYIEYNTMYMNTLNVFNPFTSVHFPAPMVPSFPPPQSLFLWQAFPLFHCPSVPFPNYPPLNLALWQTSQFRDLLFLYCIWGFVNSMNEFLYLPLKSGGGLPTDSLKFSRLFFKMLLLQNFFLLQKVCVCV